MKLFFLLIIFFSINRVLIGQQDTLFIHNYVDGMLKVGKNGEPKPITHLQEHSVVGFFLHQPQDTLKNFLQICNNHPVFIWINGQLVSKVNECETFDVKKILNFAQSDTVYLSISTTGNLANLTCKQFKILPFLVEKETKNKVNFLVKRNIKVGFKEFVIQAVILLLLFLGNSKKYFSIYDLMPDKFFLSLKRNSFIFSEDSIFDLSKIFLILTLSLLSGFSFLYFDEVLHIDQYVHDETTINFWIVWLWLSLQILFFITIKGIFLKIVCNLFSFKELTNRQLMDFIKFNYFIFISIFILILLDFIFDFDNKTFFSKNFLMIYPMISLFYVGWFTFKFIYNYRIKKLIIISYLCTTELIPVIFLINWFLN